MASPIDLSNILETWVQIVAADPACWPSIIAELTSPLQVGQVRRDRGWGEKLHRLSQGERFSEQETISPLILAAIVFRTAAVPTPALGANVLRHEVKETRQFLIVKDIAERVLQLTARSADGHAERCQYLATKSLADAYAHLPFGSRVENQVLAEQYYRLARNQCERQRDPDEMSKVYNNWGVLFRQHLGISWEERHKTAIDLFGQAVDSLNEAYQEGRVADENYNLRLGQIFKNLGNAYRDWNPEDPNLREEMRACAIAQFQMALEHLPAGSIDRGEALHALGVARVLGVGEENDPGEALAEAIEYLTEARAIFQRRNHPLWFPLALVALGSALGEHAALADHTDLTEARACFREAVELYRARGIVRELVSAHYQWGRLEEMNGNYREAYRQLQQAVDVIERDLSQGETDAALTAGFTQNAEVYDYRLACSLQLAEIEETQADFLLRESAELTERARARNLAEWMVPPRLPQAVPPAERKAVQRLLQLMRDRNFQLLAAERKLAANTAGTQSGNLTQHQHWERLSHQRRRLQESWQRIRERLTPVAPQWNRRHPPLSALELKAISQQTQAILLTLRVTQRGTSAIAITPAGNLRGRLFREWTWENLNRSLALKKQLHAASEDATEDYLAGLTEELLSSVGALWRSVHPWLLEETRTDEPAPVVLLPGPGLSVLPLHASCWEEGASRRWAFDDFVFTYAPSIRAFELCSRRQTERIGNPPASLLTIRRRGGDELDAADWEVEHVARLMDQNAVSHLGHDGRPFDVEDVLAQIPGHRVLLMPVHGCWDEHDPWTGSGLVLDTSGTGQGWRRIRQVSSPAENGRPHPSGLATVRDFFRADLSQNCLTVLTACVSGVPDLQDLTAEQVGLPTALLAAGGSSVIAAMTNVPDTSTALLSYRLFQELIDPETQRIRTRPAVALRRAQAWLRSLSATEARELIPADKLPKNADTPFEHPQHWAMLACYGAL